MGSSKKRKEIFKNLSEDEKDRIVRMCWEDRSSFEVISHQFDISANDIIHLMRNFLPKRSFENWRKRTHKFTKTKHQKYNNIKTDRFKCSRQRIDGSTKGWK